MTRAALALFLVALSGCLEERALLLSGKACDDEGGCAAGYACQEGVCVLEQDLREGVDAGPVCDEGERRCAGDVPQLCEDGAFVSGSACPFVCQDGACAGSCRPGDASCSGNERVVCTEDGEFPASGTPCEFVCTNGVCEGACVPDTRRCSGLVPETCDDGVYVAGTACPFVCQDGACAGSCRPGDAGCVGDERVVCTEDGEFPASGTACEFVCTNGVCEGACVPDTRRCSGLVPETCDNTGHFVPATACAGYCLDGACVDCEPSTKRCGDGEELQTCSAAGAWDGGSQVCEFVCDDLGLVCSGNCEPGYQGCDGAVLETCPDGYLDQTTCPYVCNPSTFVCDGNCTPNAVGCNGDTPTLCSAAGAFEDQTPCGGGTPFCDDGSCFAPVIEGFPSFFPRTADLSSSYVYARRIPLSTGTRAVRLGLSVHTLAGSTVILGLYSDAGGIPGNRLGVTAPTVTVSGSQEIPLLSEVPIGGAAVWLVASFSAMTGIGWANLGITDTAHWSLQAYDGTLPSSFSSSGNAATDRYNFWIVARP